MRFGEGFRVALGALSANRLRSALTMIGVVIGVTAVALLVAIGSGAKQEVEQQVECLGSNLILVLPGEAQFQTVGGFVVFQLGHIPAAGELFMYAGRTFEVVDMDGARVDKVLVTRPEDSEKAPGGTGA